MLLFYLQMLDTPEDMDKFEQVYTKYCDLLFHVTNNILNNIEDAEDAVQLAFVSIAENIDKINEVMSPQTKRYVVTTAEHKAFDIIRLNKRIPYVAMDESDIEKGQVVQAIEYCSDDTLSQCILKLKPNYRKVLILKYCHGYSLKEIADVLKISEANATKLDQRAKKKLLEMCKEENLL